MIDIMDSPTAYGSSKQTSSMVTSEAFQDPGMGKDVSSSEDDFSKAEAKADAKAPFPQTRTTGSPLTRPRQVCIGSAPPSLDVVPVTRNNSQRSAHPYVDVASTPSTSSITATSDGHHAANIVTPEPGDFSAPNTKLTSLDLALTGPSIPKLRANSVDDHLGSNTVRKALAVTLGDELLQEEFAMQYPLPFPPYRQFYSFTNRQPYEYELCMQHMGDDAIYISTQGLHAHVGGLDLEPYQPSRPQDFGGIRKTMPEEVLEGIFITRRQSTDIDDCSLSPITMEKQQWYIPSIHTAHQLQGTGISATTSYTEHTKDNESLHFGRRDCNEYDDASLSSHFPSLYLPDSGTATAEETLHLSSALAMARHRSPYPRYMLQPQQIEHTVNAQRYQTEYNDDDADLSGYAVYDYGERSLAVDRRKRKQRQREESAFEWLQSVQGNKHVLAEASSSKFLTGNSNQRRRSARAAKGESNSATNRSVRELQVPVALRKTATPAMLQRQALSLSAMESENED
jgi:hypothetical protein